MASTNRRNRYTGVGQQEQVDDQLIQQPQTQQQPRLAPRCAQIFGAIAIVYIFIHVLYIVERHLAFLLGLAAVAGVVALWIERKKKLERLKEYEQEKARIARINREREETEATVHEAAQMMLDIDREHLEDFIKKNQMATYEEWISDLHPDNVQESGTIDHRFYVHDSDHRLMWNESADGVYRKSVEAKSSSSTNETAKEKEFV